MRIIGKLKALQDIKTGMSLVESVDPPDYNQQETTTTEKSLETNQPEFSDSEIPVDLY